MVNGIPIAQYKGNTNFKDNMEELFIKVCEKMDEKPPVTDKDLAEYGISYVYVSILDQRWFRK